ncbi:MAG: hypothetical protein HN846_02530 [Candidatus Pacebacteria bacterium]|jgi:hypothetical protein|nr:hypothetical protein [Candidatus Paceibacterota bacterium]MBT3512299.1 hypothetical protein [Candidatus Paceibacterota bacterium]MBT4004507.1 hypothetical protein [Candidatus Paceibacterota bacterium]MBT4358839.1 hypothetical protein [Candidatus Paceibacterota bacterium]MBT4681212.1 hypothetical protein [Candidatus Paceibacterota bacterium]
MPKLPQTITNLTLGVLIVNVIGLWTVYLISKPDKASPLPSVVAEGESPLVDSKLTDIEADELIELKYQVDEISEVVATLAAQPATITKTVTQTVSTGSTKEYVIYLGSGSTVSRDWVEVDGTKTTINTANYPVVKNLEFQASLKIVGGEARARLKNKTTGAIFHDSEVMHNSSTTTWVSRTGLPLHGGNNEYVVELRSTSGELAHLEGARVRITVE